MARSLPPLNALRAFEAAARLQSFTRAAEELNVSHSAISRHVRGLEKRLSVQLFKTAKRGVSLTDVGRAYASQITPLLDQIALATEQVVAKPKGLVKISAEPTFAQKWLVPRLGRFHDQFPGVDIRIASEYETVDVAANAVDIALRYCAKTTDITGFDCISDRELYPFAAPDYAKRNGSVMPPTELSKLSLLGAYIPVLWQEWFIAAGFPNHLPLKITPPMQSLLTIEYAIAGQGVAIISSEVVAKEVNEGKLIQLSDIGLRYGGYYLITNETASRRKAVRAFRNWVLEESAALRDDKTE